MTSKNYIVADIGASNGRISRGSFDGNTLGLELVHRFENIPVTAGRHLYWDYLDLYQEIKNGIVKAASGHNITSMAVDTWNIDFALMGKDGRLILNPLHYRDPSRSDPVLKGLYDDVSLDKLFSITGWNPTFLMAAPYYLYYLNKTYPYILKNTQKFLMMPDLFNYFLSGDYFTEYTIASGSIMMDFRTGTWDERILRSCGLKKDKMPPIMDSGEYAAKLYPDIADQLGVDAFNISTCASHDTASAVAGIPAKDRDFAFLGTGTWFMLGIETGEKIINRDVIENGFTNEGGVSGSNFFAKNTAAGFWILQECRKKWYKTGNKEYSWDEIVRLAKKSRAIESVIDVEDPAFSAGGQDMPELIRDFCRKTSQQVPESVGETAYIIFASLALTVKKYLTEMEDFTGRNIETLHMIGGGVYNALLCQLISNITGAAILAGPAESASMGNLIMQLKAGGDIKDVGQGRELIYRSIDIQEYHPRDRSYWEEGFDRFKGILEKNNK